MLNNHPVSAPTPSTLAGILARAWDAGVPRFKRWRASRKLESRISILLYHAKVYVSNSDDGTADFAFFIANFTKREISLDRIALEWWQLGSCSLPSQSGFLRAKGDAKPLSVGTGWFSVTLHSADIRAIRQGVSPATNLQSSPSARLYLYGICIFKVGQREIKVPFQIEHDSIRLNIPREEKEMGQAT